MELSKEVKNKIMVIITLMILMLAVSFIYFTPANVDYNRGYDTPVPELVL